MSNKKIKILLLANNWVGLQVAKYLKKKGEKIIALGIHAPEKQQYTQEIINTVEPKHLIIADKLRNRSTVKLIKKLNPDLIIAAFFGYILKPELLAIPKLGCINFHPGYLPYNRGMNPNVWPFIEGTPAGVTIHYMDKGTDTGDIIAQKEIPLESTDTAGSLEIKTWKEIVKLFKKIWSSLKAGKNKRTKQNNKKATLHRAIDVNSLDEIDLDKKYQGRELLQILRARSYKNHTFANFKIKDKKIYAKLSLSEKPIF